MQALERQQNVSVLADSDDRQIVVTANRTEVTAAAAVPKENQPPAAAASNSRHKRDVVQYSRRPVPSAKQKEQAAQSQYLTEMKEYFAEVQFKLMSCNS